MTGGWTKPRPSRGSASPPGWNPHRCSAPALDQIQLLAHDEYRNLVTIFPHSRVWLWFGRAKNESETLRNETVFCLTPVL